jgi:hypothetical protein
MVLALNTERKLPMAKHSDPKAKQAARDRAWTDIMPAARAAGAKVVKRAAEKRQIGTRPVQFGAGALTRGVTKGGSKRYGPC